jgi:hypothetical protein
VVQRGWGLLELRPMRMSLEEIFLQVTTDEAAESAEERRGDGDAAAPDTGAANGGASV